MALPKPREKFWVTDPPATFDDEDEGVILICVFTTKAKLKAFYQGRDGLPDLARKDILIRRYLKLHRDCVMLRYQGLAIDPNPETGDARIIRFDGVEGVGGAPPPEPVEPVEGTEPKKRPPPRLSSSIVTNVSLYSGGSGSGEKA